VQPSQTPYHYCFNNPTSFTDPTGLYPEKEKGDKVQVLVAARPERMENIENLLEQFLAYQSKMAKFHAELAESAEAWFDGLNRAQDDAHYRAGGGGYDTGYNGGGPSDRTGTNESGNGIAMVIGTSDERKRMVEGLEKITNSKIQTIEIFGITFILGFSANKTDDIAANENLFNDARRRFNEILNPSDAINCFKFQNSEELARIYNATEHPINEPDELVGLSYFDSNLGINIIGIANNFIDNDEVSRIGRWVDDCDYYRGYYFFQVLAHETFHSSDYYILGSSNYIALPFNIREQRAYDFENRYFNMYGLCPRKQTLPYCP